MARKERVTRWARGHAAGPQMERAEQQEVLVPGERSRHEGDTRWQGESAARGFKCQAPHYVTCEEKGFIAAGISR